MTHFSKKIKSWFSDHKLVKTTMIFVLLAITATNFEHARFNRAGGVIEWDIKSYYAYLPATFIYQDLSLEFRRENIDKFGDLIWPIETPTGKQAIITSMGMSFLYTPFFAIAHAVAHVTPWEADGYSRPYRVALTFSALFYVWLGMIFLAKILRRYFNEKVVAFTIAAITMGTNLFYYATFEAPMAHAFNFALITVFIWQTLRFYENPSLQRILLAGMMAGLISLVRPTNIIVLMVFFLWNIRSVRDFKERFIYFLRRWYWVVIMAAAFILIWVPQFIYWYNIAGSIFYFSYGEEGGRFFWHNPQICNILISYKKGWLVYTPLMVFALAGIFLLPRKIPGLLLPVLTFTVLNIYILSSWWSWWFGGGFGLRAFIDSYGLLAIPLAAFTDFALRQKKLPRYIISCLMILLILFNQFQIRQYKNNAIHWWWMNKEAYWETFLKLRPTERFWQVITLPDYDAARKGIYREIKPEQRQEEENTKGKWKNAFSEQEVIDWLAKSLVLENDKPDLNNDTPAQLDDKREEAYQTAVKLISEKGIDYYEKKMALELILKELKSSPAMMEYISDKADKNNISLEEQMNRDALWLYNNER